MIAEKLWALQNYFNSGATRSYAFRKKQLLALKKAILLQEEAIYEALYKDLRRNKEEVWITEISLVLSEIDMQLKNLYHWMQPEKVPVNLVNFPSGSYIIREPIGVVLIISAWNFPFHLLLSPLVGAIAGGNCAVLKPSEHNKAIPAVLQKIIENCFEADYVFITEGEGSQTIPPIIDSGIIGHVFFVGGTVTGRLIYQMAAAKLVPVTLELGGKSPCVVEQDADIKVAAQRIVTGKFYNCGQVCVAVDYILVHNSVKQRLIDEILKCIQAFYGAEASENYNYGRIINRRHFDRLTGYLNEGEIIYGGAVQPGDNYIEPTVMINIHPEARLRTEEIFGPILPVFDFNTHEEAVTFIKTNPNPLAFYLFTRNRKKEHQWMLDIAFGGGCINNVGWHYANPHLPLGGRGASGIGRYHGKFSFETFTHPKGILKSPLWFNPSIKYPSFKNKLGLFKKIAR